MIGQGREGLVLLYGLSAKTIWESSSPEPENFAGLVDSGLCSMFWLKEKKMTFTDSLLVNIGRNFTNKASGGKESIQAIIAILCVLYVAYRISRRFYINKKAKNPSPKE